MWNLVLLRFMGRLALEPDEQIRFCSECGAQNPWGASQCQGCGKSLG